MEKKARSKVTPDIATTIDHLQYVIPHADVYFNKEDKDYNNTLEFDISVYSSVAEPGPVDALYVWFDWKSGLTKHPKKVVLSPRDGSGDDWSIEDRGGKPPLPGIEQWWQLKPSPDINWALNKLWSFDFTQLHPIKKALSKCWILPDLGNVSRSDTPVSLSPIPQVLNPGPVIKPFHLVPWGTGQDIKTGDLVSLQWDVQPPMNGQIELGKTSIEIDPNVLDTVNLPLRSTGVHNTVKWPEGVQPSLELTATNNFLGVDLQKKLDSSIMSTQRPEVELHVLDGGKEVEVANPSGSVILQGHVYYATSATLTWDADWVRVEQSGTKLESGGEVTFITDTAQGEQGQLNPITVSLEVDKAGLGLTCATARTITFRLYGKGEPEPTPATVKYTGPYVNALTVFPVSWNSHGQLLLAAQWDVGKYGGSYNHSYDFSAQQGDNINLEEKGLTNTSTILTFMRCVAEFQTPGTATYELTAFGNEGNSFKLKAPQLDQLPRPSSLPNATFDPFPENWAQGEGFLVANDPWQGDIFYLLYYDNAGQAHILQVDSGGLRILNNWPVGTTGQKFSDIKTLQSGVVELFLLDSSDMPSITVFNPANPPSSQAYQLPLPDSDVPTCQPQLLVYGGWPDASSSPVTNVAALLVSDGDSPSVWAANLRWDEPEWNFQSGGLIPVKPGAGSTLKEGFAISRVSSFQRGMAVNALPPSVLVTNQGCWNLYWNLPEIDVLKVSNSIVDANDGSLFEDPVTHLPTSEFWSRNPGSTHVVFPGDAPTSTELPSQYNALWVAGPADPYNAYFGCTDNNLRLYSSLSAEADWSLSLDTSEKKTLVPASGSQIAVFSNTGLKAFNAYGNLPGEPFQLTFGSELKTTLDEVQLGGDDPFEITQTIVQTFQEDSGGGASVRVVYLQSDVFPNYADIQVGVPPAAAPDQPLARIRGTVNGAPFEVAFGAGGFLSAASTAPQGFNFNQGGRRVALVSAEGPKPSPVGLSLDTTASKPGATNYGVAYWLRLPGADRFLAGPVFAVFDWGFTLFLTLTDPPDGDLANAVKGKNVEIWRWAKGLDQWPVLQATIDNDDLVDKAVFHWADNSQSPWQSLQTERDTTKEKKSS